MAIRLRRDSLTNRIYACRVPEYAGTVTKPGGTMSVPVTNQSVAEHAQAGYSREVLDVPGHERSIVEDGGSRDEQVERLDRLPASCRRRKQTRVSGREAVVGIRDRKTADQVVD